MRKSDCWPDRINEAELRHGHFAGVHLEVWEHLSYFDMV
jgi:hypothetical protein